MTTYRAGAARRLTLRGVIDHGRHEGCRNPEIPGRGHGPGRGATAEQHRIAAIAGKPWSSEEDERLLAGFDVGTRVDELATAHERTRAGIEARLVKHARLEADQAPAARIR